MLQGLVWSASCSVFILMKQTSRLKMTTPPAGPQHLVITFGYCALWNTSWSRDSIYTSSRYCCHYAISPSMFARYRLISIDHQISSDLHRSPDIVRSPSITRYRPISIDHQISSDLHRSPDIVLSPSITRYRLAYLHSWHYG